MDSETLVSLSILCLVPARVNTAHRTQATTGRQASPPARGARSLLAEGYVCEGVQVKVNTGPPDGGHPQAVVTAVPVCAMTLKGAPELIVSVAEWRPPEQPQVALPVLSVTPQPQELFGAVNVVEVTYVCAVMLTVRSGGPEQLMSAANSAAP